MSQNAEYCIDCEDYHSYQDSNNGSVSLSHADLYRCNYSKDNVRCTSAPEYEITLGYCGEGYCNDSLLHKEHNCDVDLSTTYVCFEDAIRIQHSPDWSPSFVSSRNIRDTRLA